VKDVQVRGGYVLHMGSIVGKLSVGDTVNCIIDGVSVWRYRLHSKEELGCQCHAHTLRGYIEYSVGN